MNVLDTVADILEMSNVKLGFMPDIDGSVIGLFEYTAEPPQQSFGKTDDIHGVQARCRNTDSRVAYQLAISVRDKLNRYHNSEISILTATPILDIGRDDKQRQEYTINFTIRRI